MPHQSDEAGKQVQQKDITKQSTFGLQTPKKPRGGPTRWNRLAKHREAILLASPSSAQKLKDEIGLSDEQMPEILNGQKTPPSRSRAPFMTIQQDENNSPIRIQMEANNPSPYKPPSRRRLDLVREISPAEIRRANRMPLTRSNVKKSEKRICLDDIKKAAETPRQFKNELRLSADIFTHMWNTNTKNPSGKDDFLPRNEKLHLVPHSGGGKENLPNVVMASEPANSKMMGPDAGAAALIEEKLCDYVDNTAIATLRQKPGSKLFTHHADSIEMIYKTSHGLTFKTPPIDADLDTRPSVDEMELTKQLMVNCQKARLAKESGNPEKSPATSAPDKKRKRENTIESYFPPENAQKPLPVKGKDFNTPNASKPNHKITDFFTLVQENQESILPASQSSINEPVAKRTRRNSIAPMASVQFPVLPQPQNKPKTEQTNSKENTPSQCPSAKRSRKSQSIRSLSAFYQPKLEFKGDSRSILPLDAGSKDSSTPSSIC